MIDASIAPIDNKIQELRRNILLRPPSDRQRILAGGLHLRSPR
jgi:hypothetical protein